MQPSYNLQKEGRLSLALNVFLKGQFKSLRAAALSYDVSDITLGKRYRGIRSRRETQPNSRLFIEDKEEVIVRRILDLNT